MATRIALIHAVAVAMAPIEAAFKQLWPEAERVNLLEDSLSVDREREGKLTAAMTGRIRTLADYAVATGAEGILFTCSAFGEAIEATTRALSIPVLKPNEAMFDSALIVGKRIGMLATFEPSVGGMEEEFHEQARFKGVEATIESICVPGAMAALKSGDADTHNRLLAEAAPRLGHCDAILLAHFSTARGEDAVRAAVDLPILTAPGAAVTKLKRGLAGLAA